MNYDVVKIPTEEEIIKNKIDTLFFLNDVAIYYDPYLSQRRKYNKYTNFNVWLEVYAKERNIPFYQFRSIVKSFVDSIISQYSKSTKSTLRFDVPDEFYSQLKTLSYFNNSETNEYVALQDAIWYYLSLENNFTLVKKNGSYLMDENWRYSNIIQINKEGLFHCSSCEFCFSRKTIPGSIVVHKYSYIIDSNGYILSEEVYNKFLVLIKDINLILLEKELKAIAELKELDEKEDFIRETKQTPLIFECSHWRRADSWCTSVYLKNENGVSLLSSDVLRGLKMLKTGESYMESLRKHFIDLHYMSAKDCFF